MTQFEKLTQVLSDGAWHTTGELVEKVGHRFSATLHRGVKEQDWQIEKRRADNRGFEYRRVQLRNTIQQN